jgi:hypothetical protein
MQQVDDSAADLAGAEDQNFACHGIFLQVKWA